jgi:NADPH2:quinone reductase
MAGAWKMSGWIDNLDLGRCTTGEAQVLVRVAASRVNPLDTKIRAGAAAHACHPLQANPALDLAGTVEAVGAA